MSDQDARELLKQRLVVIGGIDGIVLSVFFAVMWAAAAVVNGHWVLGRDTLSELGGKVPSRWIFNIAVLLSGVMGIDFSIGLFVRLSPSKSGMAGSALLAAASVGLITVGLFPIDTGESHTIATALFFGFAALSAFTLIYPISKWTGTKSPVFIVLIAAIVLSILSIALTPIPFAEAVAVASLQAFTLTVGIQIIRDRKRRVPTS